jgi:hypothetical protein
MPVAIAVSMQHQLDLQERDCFGFGRHFGGDLSHTESAVPRPGT